MEHRDGLLVRAAKMLDLPPDVFGNVPRMLILGDGEFRMCPHKGILAYGPEEIHISAGKLVVRVSGENLELSAMTPTDLLITGTLHGVEFVR